MEASAKIAMVHKYVEAFAKQDMGIIREIYADDARVEDPVGTDVHVGIDAVCAFYEGALGSGAKLSLSGEVNKPARVVAPTRVKGGRSSLMERAAGPSPIMMSN